MKKNGDFGFDLLLSFAGPERDYARAIHDIVGVLDVREEFGTFSHEVVAASEKVPGGAHGPGIDVGYRESASAEQGGNFL